MAVVMHLRWLSSGGYLIVSRSKLISRTPLFLRKNIAYKSYVVLDCKLLIGQIWKFFEGWVEIYRPVRIWEQRNRIVKLAMPIKVHSIQGYARFTDVFEGNSF